MVDKYKRIHFSHLRKENGVVTSLLLTVLLLTHRLLHKSSQIKLCLYLLPLAININVWGQNHWTPDSFFSQSVNPYNGSNYPTTKFGTKITFTAYHPPLAKPKISSSFGYRSSFQRKHWGVDFATPMKSKVFASDQGVVRIVGYEKSGYGNYIVLRHDNGLETIYGHLSKALVRKGDKVSSGQVIALSGNTGRSTGPHLHYEIRFLGVPLNPANIVDFKTNKLRYPPKYFTSADYNYFTRKNQRYLSHLRTQRSPLTGSVYDVAKALDTPLELLCELNGIPETMKIKKGRLLRLP